MEPDPTRPHFHYIGGGERLCTSHLCWLVIDTGLVDFPAEEDSDG
jgi:hypothetical protein